MSQTQLVLSITSTAFVFFTGYCWGRAHQLKKQDTAAERWYKAYTEVLARLHQP